MSSQLICAYCINSKNKIQSFYIDFFLQNAANILKTVLYLANSEILNKAEQNSYISKPVTAIDVNNSKKLIINNKKSFICKYKKLRFKK